MHLDFALHLACPPGHEEPDAFAPLAQAQAEGALVFLGQGPESRGGRRNRAINTDVSAKSMGQEDEAAAPLEGLQTFSGE